VLTLRALRAGRALLETAPTSDVPLVVPRAPRRTAPAVAQLRCRHYALRRTTCSVFTRRTKPAAHGPRKGHILPRAETPSVVFGHAHVNVDMVCLVADLVCSVAKHGAPVRPVGILRSRQRTVIPFGLVTAVSRRVPSPEVKDRVEACSNRIRPTDFCHPTYLPTCTRARGSRPVSRPRGLSPEP